MTLRTLLAGLVVLSLAGCAIGPDYQRPATDLPADWRAGTAQPGDLRADWCRLFNDPVLERLVAETLDNNRDLVVAVARVDEARAQLGIARADQLPRLDGQGSSARGLLSHRGLSPAVEGHDTYYLHNASGILSWELDLWGKYRRASEAARANLLASEAARNAVVLSLTAETVRGYFDLRTLDQQLAIARRTQTTRESALTIRDARFRMGLTSELDYRQAEAEVATARTAVHDFESRVAAAEAGLSVLLGRSPREIVDGQVERGQSLEAITLPPEVPAGLPSELLERRPDLRQAEQELIAANARIGVAKAAYLPSISLTGLFGNESTDLAELFTGASRTWQYAGKATMPIFDFGRVHAGVKVAEARQRMLLAQYEKAIQNAFRETQVALVENVKRRQVASSLDEQVAALRRSAQLARMRYENGYSAYLELLDAERQLFQAEIEQATARRNRLVAAVDLCKALGGGWQGVSLTSHVGEPAGGGNQ